jgi:hypothetical protein
MLGIAIKPTIGVGDALQFSSVPENYYKTTGSMLVDVSRPWFFDHNPFVQRLDKEPEKTIQMWNFSPKQWDWPKPRPDKPQVYLCNAEIGAAVFGAKVFLNRPRLYRYEDYPFEDRKMILVHTHGISHGIMPRPIIDHILAKYGPTGCLYHVGLEGTPDYGIPKIVTPTLWDLASLISKARMFIGLDSGPSWIAACYPDVIVKKVRMKPTPDYFKDWIPLDIGNVHSHWDDRCHQIFNPTDDDIGFTSSYRRI